VAGGAVADGLARPLQRRPGACWRPARSICASSARPTGFSGWALALYFASQGAGRLPLARSSPGWSGWLTAVGGGWVGLRLSGSVAALFAALSLGLVLYGVISLRRGSGPAPGFKRKAQDEWSDARPAPCRLLLPPAQQVCANKERERHEPALFRGPRGRPRNSPRRRCRSTPDAITAFLRAVVSTRNRFISTDAAAAHRTMFAGLAASGWHTPPRPLSMRLCLASDGSARPADHQQRRRN